MKLLHLIDIKSAFSHITSWVASWSDHTRTLRKKGCMASGTFHCAHVDKSILWAVIGCWPRNGHIPACFSTGTGFVLDYSLAHWAETHFDQPYSPVHRSGWVCLESSGSWSRLHDMNTIPQALPISRRAMFITWHLRHPMPMGLKAFFELLSMCEHGPTPGSRNKKVHVQY